MHITCAFCGSRVDVNPMFDTSTCPNCRQVLSNGLHKRFRKALEKKQYWMRRPKSVMARAASYANGIYGFASHGAPMEFEKIERKVASRFGINAAGKARMVYTDGRVVLDMPTARWCQSLI